MYFILFLCKNLFYIYFFNNITKTNDIYSNCDLLLNIP